LRRKLIIGTASALAVLVGATAAYAAFNNYAGSGVTFAPKGAGSAAHPKIVNMTETLKAGAPAGDRAAPLTHITVKVYGVRTNGDLFPTCTDSKIEANKVKYELACPSKSRVAQGPVHSSLGPASNPSASAGTACNPYLKVFNGGKGSQVFFFTTTSHTPNPSKYTCSGLPTGATAPYDGKVKYQGKYWVLDLPLPPDISNKVANTPGLYGSLISEVLSPISQTTKVKGQTRGYMESIACQGGKRPYSITFTASSYGSGKPETQTVSGKAAC
jgi:hypothetical protein